jgi:hypothetical protein
VTQASWIVEMRERLSTPPPMGLATEGARQAALVPLFVDGGELWVLFPGLGWRAPGHPRFGRGDPSAELVPGAAALPRAAIGAGEEPWEAAERCAAVVGAEPPALLRLGMLDSLPDPSGDVVMPCVAAVPAPPRGDQAGHGVAMVRLPLRAARAPSLLEERRVSVRGVDTWVTVGHFGPVKLAGVEVEVVELLLERLFRDGG